MITFVHAERRKVDGRETPIWSDRDRDRGPDDAARIDVEQARVDERGSPELVAELTRDRLEGNVGELYVHIVEGGQIDVEDWRLHLTRDELCRHRATVRHDQGCRHARVARDIGRARVRGAAARLPERHARPLASRAAHRDARGSRAVGARRPIDLARGTDGAGRGVARVGVAVSEADLRDAGPPVRGVAPESGGAKASAGAGILGAGAGARIGSFGGASIARTGLIGGCVPVTGRGRSAAAARAHREGQRSEKGEPNVSHECLQESKLAFCEPRIVSKKRIFVNEHMRS